MSGRRSRRKGRAGEQEAARELRRLFPQWAPNIRRGWQSREGADQCDIEGTPYWIEVKRRRRVTNATVRAGMRQALHDTDGRPILLLTREDRDVWWAHLPVWEGGSPFGPTGEPRYRSQPLELFALFHNKPPPNCS